MVLRNDLKEKWNTSEGVYVLGSTKVNGKPHWLQEGVKHAIWYDDKLLNWKLGDISQLGTSHIIFQTKKEEDFYLLMVLCD